MATKARTRKAAQVEAPAYKTLYIASEEEMVTAVKEWAVRYYDKYGWSVVVETMTDEDIAKIIQGRRSTRGAIESVYQAVALPMTEKAKELQTA